MNSANTPILNEILRELKEFKNEMYVFRDNVIYSMRNISMAQEKSDAEYFRKYITIENPTLNVNLWQFGDFYNKTVK